MANADRCVCCGEIIPEGSHVCPNCKVAVNRETGMEAYAYLAKYMKENVPKKEPETKDKLKPCPFCGGDSAFIGDTQTVKCKSCGGAFIVTNPLISRLEVKEAWNRRVEDGTKDR